MREWMYIAIGSSPFGVLLGYEYDAFDWQPWALIAVNAWMMFWAFVAAAANRRIANGNAK